MTKIRTNKFDFFLIFSLIIFLIIKFYAIYITDYLFNADEAVFGLMAKYIWEGKDFPIFMWQAHYAGSISSYIIAILFELFGFKVSFLKLVSLGWDLIGVLFFSLIFKKEIRFLIPLVLIFPFKYAYLMTPYIECFGIGFLSFFILKKIFEGHDNNLLFFVFGFLNGFGIYHHPLFFPFLLTSFIIIMKNSSFKLQSKRLFIEFGFICGFLPFLVHNVMFELATLKRLIGLGIFGYKNLEFFKVLNAFNEVFGFLFLLLIILSFLYVFLFCPNNFEKSIFLVFFIVSLAFYFLNGLMKTRYLYPFFYASIGVIILFSINVNRRVSYIILGFLIFFSFSKFFSFVNSYNYPNYYKIVDFLYSKNIKYAYSDYWTAYPITFISGESILVSPRLGDSMGFYDRTHQYYFKVKSESQKCFIFSKEKENIYNIFKDRISKKGIKTQEYLVENYKIVIFNYQFDDKIFLI